MNLDLAFTLNDLSSDQSHGKTALMKALLNVSGGKNKLVDYLLDISEDMGDTKKLINSSYTSCYNKGNRSHI